MESSELRLGYWSLDPHSLPYNIWLAVFYPQLSRPTRHPPMRFLLHLISRSDLRRRYESKITHYTTLEKKRFVRSRCSDTTPRLYTTQKILCKLILTHSFTPQDAEIFLALPSTSKYLANLLLIMQSSVRLRRRFPMPWRYPRRRGRSLYHVACTRMLRLYIGPHTEPETLLASYHEGAMDVTELAE